MIACFSVFTSQSSPTTCFFLLKGVLKTAASLLPDSEVRKEKKKTQSFSTTMTFALQDGRWEEQVWAEH